MGNGINKVGFPSVARDKCSVHVRVRGPRYFEWKVMVLVTIDGAYAMVKVLFALSIASLL